MQLEVSQRQLLKNQKREERNKDHLEIFNSNKAKDQYFNQEENQWLKTKYYQCLKDANKPTYQELHTLLSGTFKHAKRRENFFTIVDRHPDYTLRCVYSGDILSNSQGQYLERCDEEHSFPQSFQRGSKAGTGRDMHAIFAAGKSANGSRGNTPFGNYGQVVQLDRNGKLYKEGKLKTYEPALNCGAVARASLYILVCYKNCANSSYLPKKCLDWLVQMASQTEVTLWEKHRNQELFRLQENRNPFIDNPKWAKLIDFSEGWQK